MKQVFGPPLVINGRKLSLSRCVRAGDFLFLTGQVPMRDGAVMTTGTVEEQTRSIIESIRETLDLAGATLDDIVKSTVYLRNRESFPGFNSVYAEYFPEAPPARTAIVADFLVDIDVELDVIAYRPDRV
ncbi:MAG: RidA family protein [Pseudomonadota bacterium]